MIEYTQHHHKMTVILYTSKITYNMQYNDKSLHILNIETNLGRYMLPSPFHPLILGQMTGSVGAEE